MSIQDDPLYEELRDGFITQNSDGGSAMLEIFIGILLAPVAIIYALWKRSHP